MAAYWPAPSASRERRRSTPPPVTPRRGPLTRCRGARSAPGRAPRAPAPRPATRPRRASPPRPAAITVGPLELPVETSAGRAVGAARRPAATGPARARPVQAPAATAPSSSARAAARPSARATVIRADLRIELPPTSHHSEGTAARRRRAQVARRGDLEARPGRRRRGRAPPVGPAVAPARDQSPRRPRRLRGRARPRS